LSTAEERAAIEAGLDPARMPKHVAIIMDGNGRWATGKGLPRLAGHAQGYSVARRMVEVAAGFGVQVLTLYTFSSENWNRPQEEVEGIMRMIAQAARAELESMLEEGVRITVSGHLDEVPRDVREELQRDIDATRDNERIILNLALNYGGRTEILDAVRRIAALTARAELAPEEIDEELFGKFLYSPQLPDPDLLIRTAGELRVSNFLLWQIAYAEIWVTDVLWPDFSREDFVRAIADYQKRVRKFGKTEEQVL